MKLVFISHVEEDKSVALDIARALEQAGVATWYYERNSELGISYLTQISNAIEQSLAIVLIISPDSVRSNQVHIEVVRAHEVGKSFIPLLKGISHAEFQSARPDWHMALGAAVSVPIPEQGVAAIIPSILRSINRITGKPLVPVEPIPVPPPPRSRKKLFLLAICALFVVGVVGVVAFISISWNGCRGRFNNPMDYYNSAQANLTNRIYDESICEYTEAIKLIPNFTYAYNGRGLAYHEKGDYDKAIADFTEVIRLAPDSAMGYYNRGRSFGEKRDYDNAIADNTEAIKRAPGEAASFGNRGWSYELKGENDRALADYTKAIELAPNDANVYQRRGLLLVKLGKAAEAKSDLDKAASLRPNQTVVPR